jgi:hypothetical protein
MSEANFRLAKPAFVLENGLHRIESAKSNCIRYRILCYKQIVKDA